MPKKIIKFSKDYNDIHNIKMDYINLSLSVNVKLNYTCSDYY